MKSPEPRNEGEPVAWMTKKGGWVRITDDPTNPDNYDIPLYLHPTPNAESEMTFEEWWRSKYDPNDKDMQAYFKRHGSAMFDAWNAAMEGKK